MKRTFEKSKNQKGSATVEAVVSFTGFLFVIFTILGLVNLCRAQMLISAAVDTAAKELSQYAYFYKMSGLQKFDEKMGEEAQVGKDNINGVISTVDNLYSTLGNAVNNTEQDIMNLQEATSKGQLDTAAIDQVITNLDGNVKNLGSSVESMTSAFESIGDDPLLYMRSLVAIAGQEGMTLAKRAIAAPLAKAFVKKHFETNGMNADQTLKSLGIEGGFGSLQFGLSSLFCDEDYEDIRIVVVYEIQPFQIFDWGISETMVTKQAVCRAWLGGDTVIVQMDPTHEATGAGAQVPEGSEGAEGDSTETTTDPSEETTTDPSEETTQATTAPTVDLEGSKWTERNPNFMMEYNQAAYNMQMAGFTWPQAGLGQYGYSEHMLTVQDGVSYGYYNCAEAESAERRCETLYQLLAITQSGAEAAYKNGQGGLAPGTIKEYKCMIFVPENISDEELDAMELAFAEAQQEVSESIKEDYGYDMKVQTIFIRGGGNYDYSAED